MNAWSPTEATRTIEEVKRRSLADPQFRALALSDPAAALAKVNPRPIPEGSVRFVESGGASADAINPHMMVVVLPDHGTAWEEELSDAELENVAGGGSNPPVGIS